MALRLAGDDPGDPHMARAAAWARQHGGVESTRVFTHVWLAMVGRWDWEKLPAVPPELIFLPPTGRLSIWSFACWARQTIVALSVISAHRPVPAPPLRDRRAEVRHATSAPAPERLGVALVALDKALHRYESMPDESWPKRLIRGAALREAERWIVARQEADGSWGGIQPPMVYSTIALVLQGYPLDHPVVAAALRGLDAFALDDESGRRIEACQSPVWDTALAVIALLDAGTATGRPRHKGWPATGCCEKEVTVVGDWSVRRPGLAPGGWAFEFQNVHYPDIDDTAEVVIALRRALADPDGDAACRRAVDWLVGMQSSDGGWGAFDADNNSDLPTQLPFFDFGAVTDPPTADVTAHVVEMLAARAAAQPAGRRPCSGASMARRATRSPTGRTGAAGVSTTSTGRAPCCRPSSPPASRPRTRAWPTASGGSSSTRTPTEDGARTCALMSNPAGTAGARPPPRRRRGRYWASWPPARRDPCGHREGRRLARAQPDRGWTWDEPWFTGTGFPWDFSLNYHLYRHVFPLTALGRYLLRDRCPCGPRLLGRQSLATGCREPCRRPSPAWSWHRLRLEAMALGAGRRTVRPGDASRSSARAWAWRRQRLGRYADSRQPAPGPPPCCGRTGLGGGAERRPRTGRPGGSRPPYRR